jgi:hypothetical protein
METWSGMRVETLNGQGRGHAMATPDSRRRRAHWLINLVHALEHADLDAARVQFAGLVQADPGLSQQPLLHRIGNALQSSNLRVAQQLGQELRDEGLTVWNDLAHTQMQPQDGPTRTLPSATPTSSLPAPVRVHRASNGQHIVDFRA